MNEQKMGKSVEFCFNKKPAKILMLEENNEQKDLCNFLLSKSNNEG